VRFVDSPVISISVPELVPNAPGLMKASFGVATLKTEVAKASMNVAVDSLILKDVMLYQSTGFRIESA
jgi:hypothetical protein